MTTPLTTDQLYTTWDISQFNFNTTEELADTGVLIGQERALGAIHFGLGVEQQGFNVFAIGPAGSGKSTAVREILQHEAEAHPPPNDWCYVNNFDDPAKPRALSLPAGEGKRFSVDIGRLIEELSVAIPATFKGEEYRSRAEEIEEKAKLALYSVTASIYWLTTAAVGMPPSSKKTCPTTPILSDGLNIKLGWGLC